MKSTEERIEYPVSINGIKVIARYSQRAVNEIFLPLLGSLTQLQREKGSRLLVMLAAPPGCGKTTLLSFLEKLSQDDQALCPVQGIGMDGFHRRQEYLASHFVERNGRQVSMVEIKGAPITFDLQRLTDSVKSVARGEDCFWPIYDRMLHNPVENALRVHEKIILLEGNYLLLDEAGWRGLSAFADYSISITADEALLRSRLIERKIKTGVEKETTERFVDFSDMPNVRLCLHHSMKADLSLRLDETGDYFLV